MLNSINNKPLFQNGVPITTKKDKKGHGIGIKSILKIVKKYHGNLDYTYILINLFCQILTPQTHVIK